MCTRVLICSSVFAPPTKVEQIRTRVLICTRVHFHKTRLHDQNTPQVQIYTPGVYLHRGVYCAYERGFRKCNLCNSGTVGDEFHYFLECCFFDFDRKIVLPHI